jgi:hypothetical protein
MPIWLILQEAFSQVWLRRIHFVKLMLPPLIATVILDYLYDLWNPPNTEQPNVREIVNLFLWIVSSGIISALFAVVIHRSILLEEQVSSSRWLLRISRREISFVSFSLLIGGGMWLTAAIGASFIGALMVPLNIYSSDLFRTVEEVHPWVEHCAEILLIGVGVLVLGVPASYFAARTSLVLPATAVDQRQNFRWAWAISKPHSMRLAFLVGIIPLASVLLQAVGSLWTYELLWNPVHQILTTFLYCSLLVVEIAILSLSYRWIVETTATTQHPGEEPKTEPV